MKQKPTKTISQLLSISMGFMGIQMGFAVQNANASRILQIYGAGVEHLSWFWIVAPLTGMIVQPIIGHYSDNTWTRLGRRRPFFLAGAILTALALIALPNAGALATILPAVFVGAGFLMFLDVGCNITMEPFRALVADMVPPEQTTKGFAVQTLLIGVGAVVGSWLPFVLNNYIHIDGISSSGVPLNLLYSFYIVSAVLIITILWTVCTTKEYTPEELLEFNGGEVEKKQKSKFTDLFVDIIHMPRTMIELGVVQFFSWMALFGMWVYSTPAIAEHFYGVTAADTELYSQAGDWVGILFGVYNAVAMVVALALIPVANRIGRKRTHAIALTIGGLSLISIFFISSAKLLIIPMIGVGIAWASILAMPYAILAPALPANKSGVYMGIFNFFITIPQIINALFSGLLLKYLFGMHTINMLIFSGVSLIVAACTVLVIKEKQ